MLAGQLCLEFKLLAARFSLPYPPPRPVSSPPFARALIPPNLYLLSFAFSPSARPPCLPTDDGTTPATQVRTPTAPYRAPRLLSITLAV